jgi:UDP-2,3-diacylglucosamine pyrophosphatase LpxH
MADAKAGEKILVNTIVISDIHLGSEVARPQAVRDMLNIYDFNRLILLGDIFDDLNFTRLKKEHWGLLSDIRKLSNPKHMIEVIWVEGNHDEGLIEIMSHLIGIDVLKEYIWNINGKRFLAIHGHQFDRFLIENVVISNIASYIYTKIQKFGKDKQTFARYVKAKSKGWLKLAGKIAMGASEYGRQKKAQVVICGHTHIAVEKKFEEKNITYYNAGCWTDIPSTYLLINTDGKVNIKFY